MDEKKDTISQIKKQTFFKKHISMMFALGPNSHGFAFISKSPLIRKDQ